MHPQAARGAAPKATVRSTIVDKIRDQDIQLIINTPHGMTAGGSPRSTATRSARPRSPRASRASPRSRAWRAAVQGIEALHRAPRRGGLAAGVGRASNHMQGTHRRKH